MTGFKVDVSLSVREMGDVYLVLQCPYCYWFVEREVPADLNLLNRSANEHRKEHPWSTQEVM